MDLAGIAAIAGVPLAILAAVVAMLRERAPLRRLERVAPLVESMDDPSRARRALQLVQDDLALRVGLAETAPREVALLLWCSYFAIMVFVNAAFLVAVPIVGEATFDLIVQHVLLELTVAGFSVAAGVMRYRRRRAWRVARLREILK